MPHLEPTYLRYIYDGLIKGNIHPENAAELPDGLIGLYEEAFEERKSVIERQKLLQRFAIWALLKKEVSAAFVAEVVGESEDDIQEFISNYSAWFNSPESGKYQLYHERLKVYLLQKLSEEEIQILHEKVIARLEQAVEEQKADEYEWYGLEFLAGHLSIAAMLNGDGKKLIVLAYSQTHWQRQLKISKGYSWTNNGLKQVMTWASKYNDDEVIECGLQMVDLHHQEQNAAPQIVALIADGEFDAALKCIEQFGGSDKEGLQRKFIIYMLCLMDLTLLDSKDKPNRKDGIEKLLKHLDEQLPVDHSILKWSDFFPSYPMFLMAFEWAALGLDYLRAYKRTDDWDKDWITEKGPYNDSQFEVLLDCARAISDDCAMSSSLAAICTELAKQGKVEEALTFARGISDDREKSRALKDISTELVKQGHTNEAESVIQEALECALAISHFKKSSSLAAICTELGKQGNLAEALTCARGISDDREKSRALNDISAELAIKGKTKEASSLIQEALECTRAISDNMLKSNALKAISTELAIQGKAEEAAFVMQEALQCARGIDSNTMLKSIALNDISAELAIQGKTEEAAFMMQEALECARGIDINNRGLINKVRALKVISAELVKQGRTEEGLECVRGISNNMLMSRYLKNISTELAKQGKTKEAESVIQEALECTRAISDNMPKSNALKDISTELAIQGKAEEAAFVMQEALQCARGISNNMLMSEYLKNISTELAKQGKTKEALECARGISNNKLKGTVLKDISTKLAKQGNTKEAESVIHESLECARAISNNIFKSWALKDISTELAKQGNTKEAESVIHEALECARAISNYKKSNALKEIAAELVKQGHTNEAASVMQEALTCARGISYDVEKSRALEAICTELAKQGNIKEAASVRQEALECARASSNNEKSIALKEIAAELVKQGNTDEAESVIQEALTCARGISVDREKSRVLNVISAELAKQGSTKEAASVIQEALECARAISDNIVKSIALKDISTELAKQGNLALAQQISLEIPSIAQRQNCWIELAISIKEIHGICATLEKVKILQTEEARIYYLKGIFISLTPNECNKELILSAREFYLKDVVSLEKLFQNYALCELFFQETSSDKIKRLNRTLNIQWAIDIKNQLIN